LIESGGGRAPREPVIGAQGNHKQQSTLQLNSVSGCNRLRDCHDRLYAGDIRPCRKAILRMQRVQAIRIQDCNGAPVCASRYVLYWMIATRRLTFNFALDRALEHCRELGTPLVIFEALRCGYRWASDRMHRFVIEGMADNAVARERAGLRYFPYVEPTLGAGSGLLEALARDACVVVTDDYPCFFLPRMVAAAAKKLPVRLEAVDSNGMLPLRAASQVFSTAYAFRRFLQKTLPTQLAEFPNPRHSPGSICPKHLRSRKRWRRGGRQRTGACARAKSTYLKACQSITPWCPQQYADAAPSHASG
jgi:hypothetical protein